MADSRHRTLLKYLTGSPKSPRETALLFKELFQGHVAEADAVALLTLLAKQGESEEDLCACLSAIRGLEPYPKTVPSGLLDTCGTGGDRSGSYNISTACSLIAAAGGVRIAKHGNRSITSKCGSSDLLESFGIPLSATRKQIIKMIEKTGFGYFHAPNHHPAFAKLQALRKKLQIRTILNLLGPLINPLPLSYQMIGVSDKRHLTLFAAVLKQRKELKRAWVYHSSYRTDEISASVKTWVKEINHGKVSNRIVDPKMLGFGHKKPLHSYRGGNANQNKKLTLALFKGDYHGPLRDWVVLNAAAAFYVSKKVPDLKQGISLS